MKMPKIHLNEKQSKVIILILSILAAVSSAFSLVLYIANLCFNRYLLSYFLLFSAVVLFLLFLFKLRNHEISYHRLFSTILLLFTSYFLVPDLFYLIYRISIFDFRYVRYNIINFDVLIGVVLVTTLVLIYKKSTRKKVCKTIFLIGVLLAILNPLNLFFMNIHNAVLGITQGITTPSQAIFTVLYYSFIRLPGPCFATALYIYYQHNPLVPNKPIDPNAYAPVEALRLLKEQFTAGIIDEETYARLRGEALKKL